MEKKIEQDISPEHVAGLRIPKKVIYTNEQENYQLTCTYSFQPSSGGIKHFIKRKFIPEFSMSAPADKVDNFSREKLIELGADVEENPAGTVEIAYSANVCNKAQNQCFVMFITLLDDMFDLHKICNAGSSSIHLLGELHKTYLNKNEGDIQSQKQVIDNVLKYFNQDDFGSASKLATYYAENFNYFKPIWLLAYKFKSDYPQFAIPLFEKIQSFYDRSRNCYIPSTLFAARWVAMANLALSDFYQDEKKKNLLEAAFEAASDANDPAIKQQAAEAWDACQTDITVITRRLGADIWQQEESSQSNDRPAHPSARFSL